LPRLKTLPKQKQKAIHNHGLSLHNHNLKPNLPQIPRQEQQFHQLLARGHRRR
jgi:hypothetical protein